jgi:curved DNA-binding protein
MAAADYYQVLGVKNDASTDQIKSAFRKLARKCHPDVAADDPKAADKFARIREAYETLVDPARRERYDRRGVRKRVRRKEWRPPGGWGGFSARTRAAPSRAKRKDSDIGLEDIFNDFDGEADFGFGDSPTGAKSAQRTSGRQGTGPRNKKLAIDVPARVARLGGTVTIRYERMRRSSDGVNAYPYNELYDLRVPPRTCTGDVLTVPRMGDADSVTGRYGNLLCRMSVVDDPPPAGRVHATAEQASSESAPAPQFKPPPRAPDPVPDLQASTDTRIVPVSFVEAVLGGRIEVSTGKGKVRVTVPPGSSSGTRLRLRGRGRNGGDLYVVLKIVVPRHLDEESRLLIQRFAELNPTDPRADDD